MIIDRLKSGILAGVGDDATSTTTTTTGPSSSSLVASIADWTMTMGHYEVTPPPRRRRGPGDDGGDIRAIAIRRGVRGDKMPPDTLFA